MHHLSTSSSLLSKLKPLSLIYVKSQRWQLPNNAACITHYPVDANAQLFHVFLCYPQQFFLCSIPIKYL